MTRKEFKEVRLRAIDCENLGFHVVFVTCNTDEERQLCVENAKAIHDRLFPEQPNPIAIEDAIEDDELWDADPNCNHEVYESWCGGIKCRKCSGWFCY